jgi:hypothetical protein
MTGTRCLRSNVTLKHLFLHFINGRSMLMRHRSIETIVYMRHRNLQFQFQRLRQLLQSAALTFISRNDGFLDYMLHYIIMNKMAKSK